MTPFIRPLTCESRLLTNRDLQKDYEDRDSYAKPRHSFEQIARRIQEADTVAAQGGDMVAFLRSIYTTKCITGTDIQCASGLLP